MLQFSLTNLKDFDPSDIEVEDLEFNLFDKWILGHLNKCIKKWQ